MEVARKAVYAVLNVNIAISLDEMLLRLIEHPCGGGVKYLHRDPASRKRQRNGTKKGRAIA
jgi:hypothetical protein